MARQTGLYLVLAPAFPRRGFFFWVEPADWRRRNRVALARTLRAPWRSLILPDLASFAEAGFAKAGSRLPPPGCIQGPAFSGSSFDRTKVTSSAQKGAADNSAGRESP